MTKHRTKTKSPRENLKTKTTNSTPVKIELLGLITNQFTEENGHGWYVTRLIDHAAEQELEPFDLPLKHIDLGFMPFSCESVLEVAVHLKRTLQADLAYPIIMDASGRILDGWHRILKSLITEQPTIKTIRFDENPPHDF